MRSPTRTSSSHKLRSPVKEKLSDRARSPKHERPRSPVRTSSSRSPSPRTKRLRQARAEREEEKVMDKDHGRNASREGRDKGRHSVHGDKRDVSSDRRLARDKSDVGSMKSSRHDRLVSPEGHSHGSRQRSHSPPGVPKAGARDEAMNVTTAERSRFIMPRRKRDADVQFQFSQTEAGTSLAQQHEATPSSARQAEAGASTSAHQVDASPSAQYDPPAHHPDDEVIVDNIQIQDGSGRVRRRRGPTLVRDVWQLREGERIIVECNQLGQPIKKSASLLTSFLGTVARRSQLCPLNYAKWNDMPSAHKVELLRVVQSKFALPPDSNDFVLKSLNRKWKEYKAKLKGDYKREGMTEEEVAHICPPDVHPHQWRELVHYWFSERAQTYSAIGRAARASQSVPHTSGSKSFARLRHEFVKEHGREPGEVEFYQMTHTHRDGCFVRDKSRKIFERATSLIAERAGESIASTQSSRIETEVFTELMGPKRYGRVRGYGVGVTPTQLSAVSRFTQDVRDSAGDARVRRLEAEMAELRGRYAAEAAELRERYDAELHAMRTQIEQLMHMLVPSQVPDISGGRREDDGHSPTS